MKWLPPLRSAHLHRRDGVTLAAHSTHRHVLARSLYRVRRFDWQGLPRNERLGYLAVQLAAWQPFARCAQAVALEETGALAFAWDEAAYEARCVAAGLRSRSRVVLPETLLHPPAATDGARLVACIEGFEGQLWQGGRLLASRWWLHAPDAEAWARFLRGSGYAPEDPALAPVVPQPATDLAERLTRARPWLPIRMPQSLSTAHGLAWQAGYAVLSGLLLLALVYEWRSIRLLEDEIATLREEKQRLAVQAEPLIVAREETLANVERIEALVRQVDRPSALALLAHLAEVLPREEMVLREIEFSGDALRLALQVPANATRATFVQSLEKGGWLSEVHEVSAKETVQEGANLMLQARVPWPRPTSETKP